MINYKDPLHIPSVELVVEHGDKSILLNKRMLDRQNCWTNLDLIKAKHKECLVLEDEMNATDDVDLLKLYDSLYTVIEFELQELWGFTQDANFHRFWDRPKCTCPRFDNEDFYGATKLSYINQSCPLHGNINE